MNILKHKDYEGSAEIDMDRGVCWGKILFIDDLVTYEATSPHELQVEFQNAVEDYIQTCNELGRKPQKSLKGQFNVRVSPELHKAIALQALSENVSLNDVVARSLASFVNKHGADVKRESRRSKGRITA